MRYEGARQCQGLERRGFTVKRWGSTPLDLGFWSDSGPERLKSIVDALNCWCMALSLCGRLNTYTTQAASKFDPDTLAAPAKSSCLLSGCFRWFNGFDG